MELWELENAIKKQCLWNRDTNRKFQCNPIYEQRAELGQILFIGIAEMYGFKREAVLGYVDIELRIYKKRLSSFQHAHHEIVKRILSDQKKQNDFINKIYIKTGLVHNYIRLHYATAGYITYKDLL